MYTKWVPDRPLNDHKIRAPRRRRVRRDPGAFFPSEVVRILGLGGIDYRQLRRLFEVVSKAREAKPARGRWARFSFDEVWRLRAAIELLGGPDSILPRRSDGKRPRLKLRKLEDACERLATDLRLVDESGRLRLARVGSDFVADLGDAWIEPKSRQLLFDEVVQSTRGYLRTRRGSSSIGRGKLLNRISDERRAIVEMWSAQHAAGQSSRGFRRSDKRA